METTVKKKKNSSRWCSVPQCKFLKGVSFYVFPKNPHIRKKWTIACRIGKKVTSNMFVCSAHFAREDYMPRINLKHPALKRLSIPSVNLPKRPLDKVFTAEQEKIKFERLKRVIKRSVMNENRDTNVNTMNTSENVCTINASNKTLDGVENVISTTLTACMKETTNTDDQNVDALNDAPICKESCSFFDDDENDLDKESPEMTAALILCDLKNKNINMQEENVLKCKNEQSSSYCNVSESVKKVNLMDLLKKDDDLKTFISINQVLLNNLVNAVKLCKKNIINMFIL